MKFMILLGILVTYLIIQVHGCTVEQLQECEPKEQTCSDLWKSVTCLTDCGEIIPKKIKDDMKRLECVIIPVHECTVDQLLECELQGNTCSDLWESANCFKNCGQTIPEEIENKMNRLDCVKSLDNGCTDLGVLSCRIHGDTCDDLWEAANCLKDCGGTIPKYLIDHMKSLRCVIIPVHECTVDQLLECEPKEQTCSELWKSAYCLNDCGKIIPKVIKEDMETFGCVNVLPGGCTNLEALTCQNQAGTCEGSWMSAECLNYCGGIIPKYLKDNMDRLGCERIWSGASALTNLDLPMMLLVAVVAFYNRP